MIVMMMVLGIGLVGVSIWLLVRASAVPRLRMESHLAHIDGYGTEHLYGEVERDRAATQSTRSPFEGVAQALGQSVRRSVPSLPGLDRKALNAAGYYALDPEVVHGYRVMAAGAATTLALLYGVALSHGISVLAAVLAVACGLLGWELPAIIVRRRGAARMMRIDKHMPDLIDLLVASVEAGLSVGASMALLAERFDGPLGQELQMVLQQQQLGTSGAAALSAMGERADTPTVRAFTRTLVRADALGGSIGSILRNLATDARRRRRQAANERAAKVPVKLLFPLLFLIFPALFVVLLFPAAYTIVHAFSG